MQKIRHTTLTTSLLQLFFIAVLSITFMSCQNRDLPGDGEGDASISLLLSTDSTEIIIKPATKAATLTPEDFQIRIENTKGQVLRSWPTYNDVPGTLNVVSGSYKLVAWNGDITTLPAFDTPVFGAESKFTVTTGEHKAVELNCKPLFTKIAIAYSDAFASSYQTYGVDLKTVGDSLAYSSTDTGREGYFKPGPLRMRFRLTTNDQSGEYLYYYNPNIKTREAEFYKLTINAVKTSGHLSMTIETDGTTRDTTIAQTVPDFWLPRAAPSILGASFGQDGIIPTTEGLSSVANVTFKTRAGVKSAVITTESAQLRAGGFPAEGIDLLRGHEPSYQEKIQLLRKLGFTWPKVLDDPEQADLLTTITPLTFDFNSLVANLNTTPGVTTDHKFQITLTDKYDQTNPECSFTIQVAPPRYELTVPTDDNMWSRHAYLDIPYTLDRAAYLPAVQQSTDNGQTWVNAVTETVSNSSGLLKLRITNLTADSHYQFRAVLGGHTTVSTADLVTEPPTQVPNSNLDEWTIDTWDSGSGKAMPRYRAWKSGESNTWWATNNDRTVRYNVFKNAYNCFPAVSYINGRNGKAAEIRTISASGAGINSSTAEVDGNRTPGRLFIGDYAQTGGAQSNGESITRGRPFASRPLTLQFYYQYEPWGTDAQYGGDDEFMAYIDLYNGDTKIGHGEFKHRTTNREAIVTWTLAEIQIDYDRVDLKANKILIDFVSTTASSPVVSTMWERSGSQHVGGKVGNDFGNGCPTLADFNYGGNMWQYYGSVLRIDDINLVY